MPYKEIIDNLNGSYWLDLRNKDLEDDDIKSLAQALKGNHQITHLDLSNNNIGCDGLKNLSQILKDIQITKLVLRNNKIRDKGVKYLIEALINTQITHLDLAENEIGIDGAECLNKLLLDNTKLEYIHFDIFCECETFPSGILWDVNVTSSKIKKFLSWNSDFSNNSRKDNITLHYNKIGIKVARYINETFQSSEISCLKFTKSYLSEDSIQYLSQAFKNIKITNLELPRNYMSYRGSYFLTKIFKDSKIVKLNLSSAKIGRTYAKCLAEFLKEIKVLKISLNYNFIRDDGMKYLVPALRNSNVMYIDLTKNFIESEGALLLSQVLPHSKLLYLNLCNNCIGVNGAKHLANGLPCSQVTNINLHGNDIEYEGYQYLINIVNATNLSWVNLNGNNIETGLTDTNHLPLSSRLPRNTIPISSKLRHIFKEIVSLNPLSNEYEFIAPAKDVDPVIELEHYAFLIRTLNGHPNSKVHIFDMICKKDDDGFDFDTMDKIDVFITMMSEKFVIFIENKLTDLIQSFDIISDNYVNLVKQFEEMGLYDIVQNLLFHRVLYYVDENQEVLYPYIYKMLHKHGMPLYSKHLEPNKMDKIISYYQDHQEIDGAQEIIDLLRSESFSSTA